MPYKVEDTQTVAHLFKGWEKGMVLACLQKVMGSIYADNLQNPRSAKALIGDFCVLTGEADTNLLLFWPPQHQSGFVILVPQTKEWKLLIEQQYAGKAKKITRYAIKKEEDVFNQANLIKAMQTLPAGYSLAPINKEIYHYCQLNQWSKDLVSQYPTYSQYQKWGLGVVVVQNNIPVAGASSYASYNGGIEIEIDTREDQRRKGLAYACGAGLILECLKRGIYPGWDAHNKASVALAEKLGYHFSHPYTAYELIRE